jgi:hypothetical protein
MHAAGDPRVAAAWRRSIVYTATNSMEIVKQSLVPSDQMRGTRDRSDPSYDR